jgi:hypothetical protein
MPAPSAGADALGTSVLSTWGHHQGIGHGGAPVSDERLQVAIGLAHVTRVAAR